MRAIASMTFTVGLLGAPGLPPLARTRGGPRPPSTIPQKGAGGPAPDRRPPSLRGRHSTRRAVPGEPGLHREEHGGDPEDGRAPTPPSFPRHRPPRELGRHPIGATDPLARAPLGLRSPARGIGGDALPEMILGLPPHALRERRIEREPAGQAVYILGNHVGCCHERLPLNRPAIASENCSHTARRSPSLPRPPFVSS